MSIAAIAVATLLSASAPHGVAAVLDHEPGSAAPHGVTLQQSGRSEAGGATGSFDLDASLAQCSTRLVTRTGPMVEASGWDNTPWASRDGALVSIDLSSAVADAAAENFLRCYGWRNRAARRYMRPLASRMADGRGQVGVAVTIPEASPIDLWFDVATGRLVQAVTHADMGSLTTSLDDWRRVGDGDYAFRRTQSDVAGQTMMLIASTSRLAAPTLLRRPKNIDRGRLTAPVTLPFTLDHGDRGHIVIDASINGREAKLVFDTGAANFLPPAEAQRYGLTAAGGVDVGGVGETSFTGGYARIAALDVGGARLVDTLAIVAPLPDAAVNPRPGLNLQGLTGAELLAAFATTIDYGSNALSFAPFRHPPQRVGTVLRMLSDGQALFVEATVEDRRGWFRLDTGDAGTVTLFPGFARLHGFSSSTPQVGKAEMGGILSTAKRRFARVSLAGRLFADVQGDVSAQRAGAFASRAIAGNIGTGLLSCFKVSIDTRRGRAAFMPLDANQLPRSCVAAHLQKRN